MPINSFSPMYDAGGLSIDDSGAEVGGLGDIIGRAWNNITGTTANNIYNSTEAQKARDFESIEAEKARQHSSLEAQKAREHELYMSNTAYTRAAQDMKNAGINPAMLSGLSSSGMSAASTGHASASSSPSAGGAAAVARASRNASSGIIGGIMRLAGTLIMMSGHPGIGAGLTGSGLAASSKAAKAADKMAEIIDGEKKARRKSNREKTVSDAEVKAALDRMYKKLGR